MNEKLGQFVNTIKGLKNKSPIQAADAIAFANSIAKKYISPQDIKIILGKWNEIGQFTSSEMDRLVRNVVDKILSGHAEGEVTPEVKEEVVSMLLNNGSSRIKYINGVITNNIPTSIDEALQLKNSIAKTLIQDAQERLAGRNVVDAQVIGQETSST
jgi:hypothetical protein